MGLFLGFEVIVAEVAEVKVVVLLPPVSGAGVSSTGGAGGAPSSTGGLVVETKELCIRILSKNSLVSKLVFDMNTLMVGARFLYLLVEIMGMLLQGGGRKFFGGRNLGPLLPGIP